MAACQTIVNFMDEASIYGPRAGRGDVCVLSAALTRPVLADLIFHLQELAMLKGIIDRKSVV